MSISILKIIAGTWFVVQSNFPLWLKGDKTNPTFHYTLTTKNGKEVLLDEVTYHKKGKVKSIRGTDYPDKENKQGFTWKGKGLLFIARSRWEVKLINVEEGWAVIYFSKTIFTPEGVDIISRKPGLSEAVIVEIKKQMENDPVLKKHIGSLRAIERK